MNNSKQETAKQEILDLVRKYAEEFHQTPEYKQGDRINYARRLYDSEEMVNLADSALEFWLTSGRYTKIFEEDFAKYLGVKHCLLVNSGSSANLVAFMALTSPLLGERAVKRGDEVITVAAGFPTTVSPIIQYGAVPVFVDITIPQYNIDVSALEKALSPKTKAVMLAHTLGNAFDIKAVKNFCDTHNLWLIEDNCDSLGTTFTLDGKTKHAGTFGDIGTSSFYPPHHMTMGEGGAVYTDNALLYKILLSMRDWGRDCVCPSGTDNICGNRFGKQYGELPFGYDHKYVYSHFGYNLKATDMQAAIGVAQLKKLPGFVEKRKRNWKRLREGLDCVSDKITLPEKQPDSDPSWFGFFMTCKVERNPVVNHIENNGIQTRMLFAGNLTKHPCFDQMSATGDGYRIAGELTNTDIIMNSGFWVGVYPGMTDEMLDTMIKTIKDAVHLS